MTSLDAVSPLILDMRGFTRRPVPVLRRELRFGQRLRLASRPRAEVFTVVSVGGGWIRVVNRRGIAGILAIPGEK